MKKLSVRTLTMLAMLTAVSIVLSRLLGFYITPSMRVSFDYFPIILAGACFGPVAGAIVGGLADFLGANVLSGLGFYPPLIVGPILAGLISGLVSRYVLKNDLSTWKRVMVACFTAEILANLLWGTYALTLLYGTPFWVLLASRAPLKIAIMAVDSQLVFILMRALRPVLKTNWRTA